MTRNLWCSSAFGLALLTAGCSSSPRPRVDAEGLRARANQAFERPGGAQPLVKPSPNTQRAGQPSAERQPTSSPSASPSSQCASLSCLNPADVFAAEGIGDSERRAQQDASAQLSARIESSIESVVRSRYTESDQGSDSQSSIERAVKTSFKYGELIRYLPAQGEAPQLRVVAYFKKADYLARLKRDYGGALKDVRFQLKDAVAPDASPSLFVQAWRACQEPLKRSQRYAQLYQAVMGERSEEMREVSELIETAERHRRRILSRAQLVISYQGSADPELQGAISSLLQGVMTGWQLRSRVGEVCPAGGYQLRVETSTSTSTHIATGTPMSKLQWSVATRSCRDQAVISRAQLPALSGVERANKSSKAALVGEVGRMKRFLTSGQPVRNKQLAKKLSGISTGLYQVLSESFPINATVKR